MPVLVYLCTPDGTQLFAPNPQRVADLPALLPLRVAEDGAEDVRTLSSPSSTTRVLTEPIWIGEEDSARFSKLFGARDRLFQTRTASSGRGQARTQSSGSMPGGGSSHRGGNASEQYSTGWGQAPRSRPDFTPTELRRLADHHAVVEKRDISGHTSSTWSRKQWPLPSSSIVSDFSARELIAP